MKRFQKLLLILALAFIGQTGNAGVNLKNGNFYISYTDIIVPGAGETLEITRTYNSKSTETDGWFGVGWGSKYETRLVVDSDGSVTIHEYGAGSMTRFTPKDPVNADAAAAKILEAMRKKTSISDKVAKSLLQKLVKDQELRLAYSTRYDVKAPIANGTVLYATKRGYQELHKVKEGFRRVFNDGKEELFNEDGKLLKIKHKDGYAINFAYKKGILESIKDSAAKQLFFDWYADGKVKSIWSAGDKKTEYKYNGKDLVESKDVGGNVYKFSYDSNHNLTNVAYSDKTNLKVSYEPKTQFVSSVTTRNNETTSYEYGADPKNPDLHYWTTVSKKDLLGKVVKNKYEYEIRLRQDGSQYTYQISTDLNGSKTVTTYSDINGLPVEIMKGKQKTTFKYNDKGLLLSKNSSNGEFVNLEYHDKFNKITKVSNKEGWTSFQYDKDGNLSKAVNSQGKTVMLVYDRKGRITKMVDAASKGSKSARTLSFEYNSLGKPAVIAIEKLGKINIDYDNYGEIKKVESKAGHKMAVQVTQAFQNLLAIVKPAGVSLNL